MIVHLKSGYVVRSKNGEHLGGPYPGREEAERRLRQVEFYGRRPARLRGRKNPLGSGWGFGLLVGAAVVGGVWGLAHYFGNRKEEPASPVTAGRATWIKWHNAAAAYVPAQSAAFQQMVLDGIQALPCPVCVNHALTYVAANPIALGSRDALRKWVCDFHNEVNARIGKPAFDCSKVP